MISFHSGIPGDAVGACWWQFSTSLLWSSLCGGESQEKGNVLILLSHTVAVTIIFLPSTSPPPLCGCVPVDDKYKCKPSDQVRPCSSLTWWNINHTWSIKLSSLYFLSPTPCPSILSYTIGCSAGTYRRWRRAMDPGWGGFLQLPQPQIHCGWHWWGGTQWEEVRDGGREGGREKRRKQVLGTFPWSLQAVQCEQEEDHSTAHLQSWPPVLPRGTFQS